MTINAVDTLTQDLLDNKAHFATLQLRANPQDLLEDLLWKVGTDGENYGITMETIRVNNVLFFGSFGKDAIPLINNRNDRIIQLVEETISFIDLVDNAVDWHQFPTLKSRMALVKETWINTKKITVEMKASNDRFFSVK